MADNNTNELDALMISELPTQATANETDLFEVAIVDANSASGYASKKESAAAIADAIVGEYQYPLRITGTTAKTIAGAINELKNLVDLLPQFAIEVVNTLPVSDISTTTIYLVPAQDPEQGNYYEEYIYVNNAWELVGTTAVDLTGYYTSAQVDTLLAAKANTSSLATVATSGAYSDLTGKPTIDTALDDTSTNAVENRAVASEINSIKSDLQDKADIITNSASGAIASFSDGADNLPVKDLIINITPVQAGSGDPSPINERPISGWTGANIYTRGFNLWDEEWESASLDPNTGEKVSYSNRIASKNYIPCSPNKQYYIYSGSDYGISMRICFYDADKRFVSSIQPMWNQTVTTPNNARYMLFCSLVKDVTTYNNDISINYPSTETAYHAYAGTTINIDWEDEAGTVYMGELAPINGTLISKWGIIDMGDLEWTYNTASGRNYFSAEIADSTAQQITNRAVCMCSCYKAVPSVSTTNLGEKEICKTANAQNRYFVKDADYTDADTFKAAVTGQKLIYELATPVTYQLTPVEVKTLLGQNNIWADTGDSSVSYRADTKKYIDAKFAELQALILNS